MVKFSNKPNTRGIKNTSSNITIYRCDGEAYRDDEDAVTVLRQIHVTRSQFGYNPEY